MDGNGRWAKSKGLPRSMGHKKGAEVLQKISKTVADLGVKYMTVYAFSTENWKRPQEEVDYLMGLLRQYLKTSVKEIQKNGARIKVIGERDMLAPDIVEEINKVEAQTSNNDKFTLCIALSYGSRQEIVSAVKKIAAKTKEGSLSVNEINVDVVTNNLYTFDIPDPDIVIRTSGEKRISNYLLWQIAYSELFFSDTYWPDFTEEELKNIINEYNSRERRYGKI